MEMHINNDKSIAFTNHLLKETDRQRIAAEVDAFISSGGKITHVGMAERTLEFETEAARQGQTINARRLSEKFNHKKLIAARQWLKRNPDATVTTEEVAVLTGAAVSTVKGWVNFNGRRYRLLPIQKSPMKFALAQVVRWMDDHVARAAEYMQ